MSPQILSLIVFAENIHLNLNRPTKIAVCAPGLTVGHRPLAEQNADMAVYWLLCTDIMADRFVSSIWNISSFIVANLFNKISNL